MTGLVIFDCDGVLVDTESIISHARLNILTALGFPVVEADTLALRGLTSQDAFGKIAKQFGKPMPDNIRPRFRTEFDVLLRKGLPPVPGIVSLIAALAVPFCVASNGSHQFMQLTLGAAGLTDKFSGHIFSADDVPRPKPYPDLFLSAAAQMGAEPEACIVIEDSVHGVKAGVAAGMRVIGFCGGGHSPPDHGDSLLAAGAFTACADTDEVARHLADAGYLK